MLKTLNTVPPGGWIYVQEYTDNGVKKSKRWVYFGPISIAAGEIADFRKGNNIPRATIEEVIQDVEEYTCQRLGNDPTYCRVKKNSTVRERLLSFKESVVAGAIRAVGNAKTGSKILTDWLGSGGTPVPDDKAQARANVCIGCKEFNREGHFFAKLTGAIARAILEQRREKNRLGRKVVGEEELHTCTVCDCHLPLKVWVPLETILDRTHPDIQKEFPAYCWIHTEQKPPAK